MNGIQRSQVQIPLTPTFYSYFKEFFSGKYHVYLSFRYTHVITSSKLQLKTNVATDEGTSKDTSVVNTIYTNIYIYIYIYIYILFCIYLTTSIQSLKRDYLLHNQILYVFFQVLFTVATWKTIQRDWSCLSSTLYKSI